MARVRPPTGNLPFRTANPQVAITDLDPPPMGQNRLDREAIASAVREGSMTIAEGQALLAQLEAPAVTNASDNIDIKDVGAAGDPNAIVNANYGALTPASLQQYLELGKNLYPTSKDVDPRLLALQFFANMAAESSKPGATAIGAAGTAGSGVVDTLLEERKQKRTEELGAATLGVNLASAFKPATGITSRKGENVEFMSEADAQKTYPVSVYGASFWQNFVPYSQDGSVDQSQIGQIFVNDAGQTMQVNRLYRGGILSGVESTITPGTKVSAIDVGDSQDSLIWRSQEDAIKFLTDKGLPANSPGFDDLVARMVPEEGYEELLGKPVVAGDSYQGITFITKGNKIVGANISPMRGAAVPRVKAWADTALKELEKNDEYISKTFNVLDQVNRGLDILMSEHTITGKWQEFILPYTQFMSDVFGTEISPKMTNIQLIQSISNVLAPKMRPVGAGSTSDMEFKAYRQAIADIGNTTLANYLTMYTFKRVAENSRDASAAKKIAIADGAGPADVKEILDKMDKSPGGSIYARFKDDKTLSEAENDARFAEFLSTRERGEVIYNYNKATGGKLIDVDSKGNEMPDFFVSDGRGSYILFR